MKFSKLFAFITVFCISLGFLPNSALLCQAHASDTIKIGLMCPITGSWASEGQGMEKIVRLLTDQVNADGGIRGKMIELLVEDDASDPRTAALAAQKLISSGILAVIGTYGSAVTEASQNIYDESEILQIATGSTSIRLSEKGLKYFFRTSPRDDEQGIVAANHIDNLGFTDIAILHDNSSYAKGLADEARTILNEKGINIVFFDALTPRERDYSAILTKLKNANPKLIFFTGYYPEAGLLLRQKMDMGFNVPMLGGDAVNHPDLVTISGLKAAEGFLFMSPPVAHDLQTKEGKEFLQLYQEKYKEVPQSAWAVLAGDAFGTLVEAMKNLPENEEINSENLAKYLKDEITDYRGFTGTFTYNRKGDRVGTIYNLYTIDEEGKFVLKQ